MITRLCLALIIGLAGPAAAAAQTGTAPSRTGKEVYEVACAACHGSDGTGTPRSVLGYDPPPDFTECNFSTVEPESDWFAVTHDGGPARSFHRRMPALGSALTEEEILLSLRYLRGFCTDPTWPRGDLNLPRPLITEKAFPENETVLTTAMSTGGGGDITNRIVYEQRLGSRSQFEVIVPLRVRENGTGWQRGLGDLAVAFKRVLAHSLEKGFIFSGAGELVLPTGKEDRGLGKGVAIFEPFLALGKMLPADSFVQAQVGAEVPLDQDRAANEAFWRVAAGKTFTEGRFGRAWSPMVELVAARELASGATVQWDIAPQLQVSLSRRQHILLSAGVQFPVNEREGRHPKILAYLLWDWFDGGFFEGWR